MSCPKSHSKWRSWCGTPGRFEGEHMFFVRMILPSHCPRETPRLQEGDMRVISFSCIEKCSILLLSFLFTASLLHSGTVT